MAHFAQLDDNNIVVRILLVSNDKIIDSNGVESEELGIEICKKIIGLHTKWKQTSYNNKIRVRFACVGFVYNEEFDAFIPPKPFNSWILDETEMNWISPLGKQPKIAHEKFEDSYFYYWDENLYLSDNTKGWVFENYSSLMINGASTSAEGDSIIIESNKKIADNSYDIAQISKTFFIKINDQNFSEIVDNISILNYDSVENKNFLEITLINCPIIEMVDDVYISYDKELIPAEYRIKGNNNSELSSFTDYKVINTSKVI
jgi:hypothetical protein